MNHDHFYYLPHINPGIEEHRTMFITLVHPVVIFVSPQILQKPHNPPIKAWRHAKFSHVPPQAIRMQVERVQRKIQRLYRSQVQKQEMTSGVVMTANVDSTNDAAPRAPRCKCGYLWCKDHSDEADQRSGRRDALRQGILMRIYRYS